MLICDYRFLTGWKIAPEQHPQAMMHWEFCIYEKNDFDVFVNYDDSVTVRIL